MATTPHHTDDTHHTHGTHDTQASPDAQPTGILALQQQADAAFLPWGSPAADAGDDAQLPTLVETFGEYEAEYAAIRKGVGLFAAAHMGVIEVTGNDRSDFLHRMITNDTNSLTPGDARRAFLLNNKGRIIADMIVLHEQDRTLIELDRLQINTVISTLENYLFSEDVTLKNTQDQWVKLSLHGPAGGALLQSTLQLNANDLQPFKHQPITIGQTQALIYRRDETGSPGLHLLLPIAQADVIYAKLADAVGGLVPDVEPTDAPESGPKRSIVGRGIGWLAYNTARIEAQTTIFRIDFGPDTLPHETGKDTLDEAVSFTKGCYLGQEVVARMQSLGHPKKILCALKLDDDRLPVAGVPVYINNTDTQPQSPTEAPKEIGAVTSSTISPMRGGNAIALAMLKWGQHRGDNTVLVPAEGSNVPATVTNDPFINL